MDYYWTIIVIFASALISFYFDKYKKYSKSAKTTALLFFHHLLNIFANFGWVSTSKPILYLYILAPVVTAVHWLSNNGRCRLTEEYNILTGLPQELPFNDVFNMIGLKKYALWNNFGHYLYLLIFLTVSLFKL
jgi:hypothetical protein